MCHHINRPAAQHHDKLPGKSIALRIIKGVRRERAGERSWGAARPRGLAKAAATPQQRSSYYSQRAIPPSTGGCASRLRPADKAHALSQQIGRTTRPAGATGVPGEGTARHADLDLGGLAPANHNTSQRSRLFERVHDRNDGRRGNHFNRRSTSGIQEIVQDTPRRPQRRQPRHGGAAYEVRSGSQATTRCMHRREKTAAPRMDVRSAAGLGRGSHRSSHTPAPYIERPTTSRSRVAFQTLSTRSKELSPSSSYWRTNKTRFSPNRSSGPRADFLRVPQLVLSSPSFSRTHHHPLTTDHGL